MTNNAWYGHLNGSVLEVGDFIYGEDDKIEVKSFDYKVDPEMIYTTSH